MEWMIGIYPGTGRVTIGGDRMSERLFSEEEVREMGKRTVDRLTEAIDAGDAEQAKKIAHRMYNEFLGMHDLYRNWTTATLSEVGKRFGDEVLEEIMMAGVKAWWLAEFGKDAAGSPRTAPEDQNVCCRFARPSPTLAY